MEKTHWKKIVSDPNFLGEADFQDGEEKVLTIDYVNARETVTTAEGKSQKAVLHFKERGVKSMILNVAKSKAIAKVANSKYIEDWHGVRIQLYIDDNVEAFGDVVSAVRVRPYPPRIKPTESLICADCNQTIEGDGKYTASQIAILAQRKHGVILCVQCAKKRAATKEAEAKAASNATKEAEVKVTPSAEVVE